MLVTPALPALPIGGVSQVQAEEVPTAHSTALTTPWIALIARISNQSGVPADVLRALVTVESGGNAATPSSPSGGVGLTQISPEMAQVVQEHGDLANPAVNLATAAHYLSAAYARWGTWDLAVASYEGMIDDTGAYPAARHDRWSSDYGYFVRYQQTLHALPGGEATSLAPAMALGYGLEAVGIPYSWGGQSLQTGFDCSGLVYWAYKKVGKSLPRSSGGQWDATARLDQSQIQPGDLVFFGGTWGSGISHVGLYAGNGYFLHSPREGETVQLTPLSDSYWGAHLAGFGRVQ
jgi:cell wall-associated NlpC family hydrolase